jgi:hypothetical protein
MGQGGIIDPQDSSNASNTGNSGVAVFTDISGNTRNIGNARNNGKG